MYGTFRLLVLLVIVLCSPSLGYASSPRHGDHDMRSRYQTRTVLASWYGGGERLSRHTSDGSVFRPDGLTVAHRSLPLGSRLRVCYTRCVVVRVTDRGPALWTGRQLDLSRGAAVATGMISRGVARITITRM